MCLAAVGQSAVGFGFALFAAPPLVWLGIPLPDVIAMVATSSIFQSAIGARHLRAAVPWRLSLIATAFRLVSVIAGLWLLKRLAVLNADQVKMVVGSILCLLVAIQFFCRPHPVERTHWAWAGLALVASGLLAGVSGMGGPPLVLWAMAHNWSTEKTRGFLFAVFATSIPVQIFLMCLTFGVDMLWNVAAGAAFLPLVYLGSAIGLPIGNRIPKERLRRIAYAILLIIGAGASVPPLLACLHSLAAKP